MKKAVVLLALLLVATLAFSQNQNAQKTATPGVRMAVSEVPENKPSKKLGDLIDYFDDQDRLSRARLKDCEGCGKTEELAIEYASLKARAIQQDFAKKVSVDEYDFFRIEGHQGKVYKTKEEVVEVYQEYLAIEIKELHIKIQVNEKEIQSLRNVPIPPPAILEERIYHKEVIDTPSKKVEKTVKRKTKS